MLRVFVFVIAASTFSFGRAISNDLPRRAATPVSAEAPGVTNAIGRGQDPAPVKMDDGHYLFPDVDFLSNVYLRVSDDLNNVQSDDANKHTVFTFPDDITTQAPDICQWDDTWVIYVSQVNGDNTDGQQLIHVLQSQTSDPLGAYNYLGHLLDTNGFSVQGTYDPHCSTGYPNGKNYLMLSTLHAVSISEISSPSQEVGDRVELWHDDNVTIEAPTLWVFNDDVFTLAYASGNFQDASYATNIMTISTSEDPIHGTWVANPNNPVIASNSDVGVYGPGSGGFFTGPDGTPWFAYGAFSQPEGFDPTTDNTRTVRVQKVNSVDSNGIVQPMVPIQATIPYGTDSKGETIF